jgi:hypothetical protein
MVRRRSVEYEPDPDIQPFIRRLRAHVPLDDADIVALRGISDRKVSYRKNQNVILEDGSSRNLHVMLSGYAIPTTAPLSSTTGRPLIRCCSIRRAASMTVRLRRHGEHRSGHHICCLHREVRGG